ncbi:MAG: RNA-binding protein [Oscillospiraceae bacterium]|jgi:RNA-binding protein YlmH|nr:RNA-binding protein [Oscillospiraceae bacterium]
MLNAEYRRSLIKKYSLSAEDELLAARVIDKFEAAERKNSVQSTRFLAERDLLCAVPLLDELGAAYTLWGGYEEAERVCAILTPDYLGPEDVKSGKNCPLTVIHAEYSPDESPGHRDFLGALMGMGIERDSVGDIIPQEGSCDIVVLKELGAFILSGLEKAGKVRLRLSETDRAQGREAAYKRIRDTVASLRLDAVVASGFSLSRDKAVQAIKAGKVSVGGAEVLKPDRLLGGGEKISLRGSGKIVLSEVSGLSRKGRTIIEIKKYV